MGKETSAAAATGGGSCVFRSVMVMLKGERERERDGSCGVTVGHSKLQRPKGGS